MIVDKNTFENCIWCNSCTYNRAIQSAHTRFWRDVASFGEGCRETANLELEQGKHRCENVNVPHYKEGKSMERVQLIKELFDLLKRMGNDELAEVTDFCSAIIGKRDSLSESTGDETAEL